MRIVTLPEYQKFLRSRRLVSEKYITFYVNWLREFLRINMYYLGSLMRFELEDYRGLLIESELTRPY